MRGAGDQVDSGTDADGKTNFKCYQVYCTQVVANGLPSVVDENECANAGPKPETKQECNVETICPSWHIGPWKPVSSVTFLVDSRQKGSNFFVHPAFF